MPAIAAGSRLSEHTVKRHVANILLKLDLPTRAAAAALSPPAALTLARTGHGSHGAFGRSGQARQALSILSMQARRMSPGRRCERRRTMLKSNRTLKSLAIAAGIGALLAVAPARPRMPRRPPTRTSRRRSARCRACSRPSPRSASPAPGPSSRRCSSTPKTALDGKTKELMGLAVAAQIPCQLLRLFPHRRRQGQRRDRRGDQGGGRHGGDRAALVARC